MTARGWVICGLFFAILAALIPLEAQEGEKGKRKDREETKAKVKPLPDDKRLLSLHLDFVKKAEKLASEYEAGKDWGKARTVYEEILKLVPQYPPAKDKLQQMIQREAAAQKVSLTIDAAEDWQDSGIDLVEGKPVTITVSGTWVFHFESETNAEGISIPKELRDFPLGCLLGRITGADPAESKPFVVGSKKEFFVENSGRLYFRIYDTNVKDNSGALKVEVTGTFTEEKE